MYVLHITQYGMTLKEMTARELREAHQVDRFAYRPVSAQQARNFVRWGGHHETGLWVDGDKVRYAKPERAA